MTDIVERLENANFRFAHETVDQQKIRRNEAIAEAAAEIERLRSEVERLKDQLGDPDGVIAHADAITSASEAEIERLRQELADARDKLQAMHRRAQAAEAQTMYSREQAAMQSDKARRTGWMKFYQEARREWTLRDREDARDKALERAAAYHDGRAAHYARQPFDTYEREEYHRDSAAAIRALKGEKG